jgi:hypothetical protein
MANSTYKSIIPASLIIQKQTEMLEGRKVGIIKFFIKLLTCGGAFIRVMWYRFYTVSDMTILCCRDET